MFGGKLPRNRPGSLIGAASSAYRSVCPALKLSACTPGGRWLLGALSSRHSTEPTRDSGTSMAG